MKICLGAAWVLICCLAILFGGSLVLRGCQNLYEGNQNTFDLQQAAKKTMMAELPTTHPEMHSTVVKYCYEFSDTKLLGCLVEFIDPQYRRMQTVLPVVWK